MTLQSTTQEGGRFERWVASSAGRAGRTGLGVALIVAGFLFISRPAGNVVAALGFIPLVTGVFNLCPVAPLWGGHFLGSRYCQSKRVGIQPERPI